jgi:hypothetical protein
LCSKIKIKIEIKRFGNLEKSLVETRLFSKLPLGGWRNRNSPPLSYKRAGKGEEQ